MELLRVNNITFEDKDFLDNIKEFEDIIDLLKDMERDLKIEMIACAEENDCCNGTKDNYFIEVPGFLDNEDNFITFQEDDPYKSGINLEELSPFTIRVYKCVKCKKWLIDILE